MLLAPAPPSALALTRRLWIFPHISSSWAPVAQGCHTFPCVQLHDRGTSFAERVCVYRRMLGSWLLFLGTVGGVASYRELNVANWTQV